MKTVKRISAVLMLGAPLSLAAQSGGASEAAAEAVASGLGINVPLVARLIGAGSTLYISSVDVANNSAVAAQVDFYLDGVDIATGTPISHAGSISGSGSIQPALMRALRLSMVERFELVLRRLFRRWPISVDMSSKNSTPP